MVTSLSLWQRDGNLLRGSFRGYDSRIDHSEVHAFVDERSLTVARVLDRFELTSARTSIAEVGYKR